MRPTINLALVSLFIFWNAGDSQAGFIQPTTASTTATPSLNTPAVLINAATGSGGVAYAAPNPGSGGGGTSWHTGDNGTTPVTVTFDFASTTEKFTQLHVWDYYFHSPLLWTLKLYSGAGQTGTELIDYDFSIVPGAVSTSTRHDIDFPDIMGPVLSGILETRGNSAGGGVGLAEFGFTTAPPPVIPEPSTLALLGLGTAGLVIRPRRRRAAV